MGDKVNGTASKGLYTAMSAFFEALCDAGVTHCFVNLGSDHPAVMEALVIGAREKGKSFPRVITCPHEMVALSMADGYARATNEPQAVIVHVDVGTQALGQAVHNASCGRAPVLIFAGLSPATADGEYPGSRTEYIHWIQDVPDQKAIVAQYCRYTGEIKRGRNIKQLVNRALSFATSEPRGPVYLYGVRESLEEEIEPYQLKLEQSVPAELGALTPKQVKHVADILMEAEEPLLITGYSGRNHACPAALVALAETVKGLRVLDTGGCDMCFPFDHPASLGFKLGQDESIKTADVILVLDCDVPWIPTQCRPKESARIIHIDVDALKQMMPVHYINAIARYKVDAETAITQITNYIKENFQQKIKSEAFEKRWSDMQQSYHQRLASIAEDAKPAPDGTFGTSCLVSYVRKFVPSDTIFAIEAVTNAMLVSAQVQATIPGSWVNSGGAGLGWSGGAALGVKLATDFKHGGSNKGKFVCQIVGDGCYMFSVPATVYWIASRYNIPVLTIVLNNIGWNAPRKSLLAVHPHGEGSKVDNKTLNISFAPTPDYAGIAKAASGGRCWAGFADTVSDLETLLPQAVAAVKGGVSAVLDAHLGGPAGKYGGGNVTKTP